MARASKRSSDILAEPTGDTDDSPWECVGTVCRYREELVSLRQQVVTDPLTGLFNLRYLLTSMEQEFERTERTNVPTALMMVDVDHFKKVNDRWGHEVGNRVLQAIADAIRLSTRRLDIQCRYGGEEFAVLLPSSSLLQASVVAERLRQMVEAIRLQEGSDTLQVTVSIGVAMREKGASLSTSELVHQADIQLYEAKRSGRNRVCIAPSPCSIARVTADEKDMMRSLFAPRRE
ncbi:GGDEF domain-containing protein [Parathalassolituus penaei]|uniref:diguanylate cyclase n=1 Tax=Parathalassolituus penaei TaxID=2997323 RepID=A0A9X3IS86_9GAMM|nr:GGDEF domain-containing protein [Parathalassolituus penaei]MCY0963893.1 GGDEF domain-containing protein [Parathalassolituus penaei]